MFERPRWMLWSAVITLTFVPFGPVHASDAYRTPSEVRSDSVVSHATEVSGQVHPENPTVAANGQDSVNVIEEIVVVGSKQKRRLNAGRILTTRPVIEKPRRFDLQLLPVYDPDEANRHFSLVQRDEQLRHVGIVTLFRLSFGRRQSGT